MPKTRDSRLESPTARRKLPVQKRPVWLRIGVGVMLGYRRNAAVGTWTVRRTGAGEWMKRIGLADDVEPADGSEILNFWQAQDRARALVRGPKEAKAADEAKPITVAEALEAYERELLATAGDPRNVSRVRHNLPAALADKPVVLLTERDLVSWRDGMLKNLARASVNRTRNGLRAALTLAAKRDRSITNARVWQAGFEALANATEARNVVLADAQVGNLVRTALEHDPSLGLLLQVLAETGARPSQAVRLLVADLDTKGERLLMPRSAKGHAHKRAAKMRERVPVPISASLTARLVQQIKGGAADAPLLTRDDGTGWGYQRNSQYRKRFRALADAIGLDRDVTIYALRHTSISRAILRGVPLSLISDLHDTSEPVIRKHYARLISNHGDEIMRKALLQIDAAPVGTNVIPLKF